MTRRELEHRADMGLFIEAPCLEELLEECRRALYDYIPSEVRYETAKAESWTVEIEAADLEDLFIRWLNELIFLWDSHLSILVPISVQLDPLIPRLSVTGRLVAVTGSTSPFKAATYGGALLEEGPPATLTVFFDV